MTREIGKIEIMVISVAFAEACKLWVVESIKIYIFVRFRKITCEG